MPNKTVIITEPVASDIRAVTIIYSGGIAQSVEVSAIVQTADSHTSHGGHCSNPATDYTAAEQTAMNNLATAAVAKLVAAKQF